MVALRTEPLNVLLVEDNPADARLVRELLREVGPPITLTHADRLRQAIEYLRAGGFNAVLLDLGLPDSEGLDTFARTLAEAGEAPIVVLTGLADEDLAVRAVREGAQDYLVKGRVDGRLLSHAVRYAVERRRVEDLLRRSEARYRALVEGSIQGILIHARGIIRLVNPALARLFLYDDPAELVGMELAPFIVPEDRQWVQDRVRARLAGADVPTQYEFRAVRRDGSVGWFETVASVLQWDGEPAILATIVDVTERRQAVEALRERDERFRQLADNIAEVFFVVDAQYREMLYINPAYEAVWGRTCASLYADPGSFIAAVVPEDRPQLMTNIAEVQAGRDPGGIEFRVVRPDGGIRHVLGRAAPIRDASGQVYRIAGVSLDITERKVAEEAVSASERRLRTLFETVNLIVIGVDASGRVEYANPYLLGLLGYALDELIGQPFTILLAPAIREERLAAFRELIEREGPRHTRSAIITKAGEERLISWHNTVVRDVGGRVTGTLSVGEDVTDRTRLEEQLRQAQKMEAVARLAGGVAHDFNNLLAAITINADLAMAAPATDPDTVRDALTDIKRAAQGGAGVTRQLLALGRRQIVAPRSVDLNGLIADAERLLRKVLAEDIELVIRPAPDLGTVVADPTQIEQILMNLAVNARDAMPDGGRLTIETANADLDAEYAGAHGAVRPGRYVMLVVGDTGTGMDRETQARIFEPFFTTKGPGQGTGLGLASVHGIVQQFGGHIWVYSEPGLGTTFKVYLPRVDAVPEPPTAPVTPPPGSRDRGHETILIVEDEGQVRQLAERALLRGGYRVLTAANGEGALEAVRTHEGPIDLVISDVVMPGMGGRLLMEELRQARPGLRMLFTSGYTPDEVIRRGVATSEMPFLPKPFGIAELTRKVREVLDAPGPAG